MQKGAAAGSEEHVPLPVLKTDRAPKSNGHKKKQRTNQINLQSVSVSAQWPQPWNCLLEDEPESLLMRNGVGRRRARSSTSGGRRRRAGRSHHLGSAKASGLSMRSGVRRKGPWTSDSVVAVDGTSVVEAEKLLVVEAPFIVPHPMTEQVVGAR